MSRLRPPFQIKICGITRPCDARSACAAGADAIGLNFYHASSRSVSIEQAVEIRRVVPSHVAVVGVFVNHTAEQIKETQRQVDLDIVQLHGDEPPEWVAALQPLSVMPVLRLHGGNVSEVEQRLTSLVSTAGSPKAILIDAYSDHQYGGTGQSVDWHSVGQRPPALNQVPLVLAGGLEPGNVETAIQEARPDAVDTASGVERNAGEKDPLRIQQFVDAARRGFEQLES